MAKFRYTLDSGVTWVVVDSALPYSITSTMGQAVTVEPIGTPIVITGNVTGAFGELFSTFFAPYNDGDTPEALRVTATAEQKKKIFYEIPPPPRINPIEPTVSKDMFGNTIFAPLKTTDNDRVLDEELDYRLEGVHPTDSTRNAVEGGVFYDNYTKLSDFRRMLLRRWDTKGYAFTLTRPVDLTVEGVRGSYLTTPDADSMLFNGQRDVLKPKPYFRMARHTALDMHGNNADGYLRMNSPNYMPVAGDPSSSKAKQSIVNIVHAPGGISKITLSSAFANKLTSAGAAYVPARNVLGSVPTLPDFFLVSGSTTPGQGVRTLQDANWRYDILSYSTDSESGTMTVTGNYNAPIYTLGGTYSVGNKIDLYIAGTKFSYTVASGSTSLGAIATALRALVATDGRFTSSTVSSNVLTVVSSGLPAATVFWGKLDSGHNVVSTDTATGGTAYWFTQYLVPGIVQSSNRTPGTHADGAQWAHTNADGGTIYQEYVMMDQCTWEGNYDGLVFANSASSDCKLQMTRTNYRWKSHAPDDVSSGSFRLGYTGGVGLIEKHLYDVWNEPRPLDGVGDGIGVTAIGSSGGVPDGTTVMGSDGVERGYASGRPEIKGLIKRGLPPGGDFSPYADNGPNFVHPGYSDFSEFEGAITDITLTGLSTISDDIAVNAAIALIDVTTTNKGGDIDLSIVSSNVNLSQWFLHGRRLVHNRTAFDAGATPGGVATVRLRAVLRGSSPEVAFEKTLNFSVVGGSYAATVTPGFAVNFEGQKSGTAKGTIAISGTTLTVSGTTTYGTFLPGMALSGTNVVANTTIVSQLTSTEPGGVFGGKGTYTVNQTQTVSSTTGTATIIAATNRYPIPFTLTTAAAADRVVVAIISFRAGAVRSISGNVTIGGVVATLINSQTAAQGTTNTSTTYIYQAVVPTGTDGTVDVAFSGTMAQVGVALFSVVGGKRKSSDGLLVPYDLGSGGNTTSNGNAMAAAMSVGVPLGGVIIAGQFNSSAASSGRPVAFIGKSAPASVAGSVSVNSTIGGTTSAPTLTWAGLAQESMNQLNDTGGGPTTMCFVVFAPHP